MEKIVNEISMPSTYQLNTPVKKIALPDRSGLNFFTVNKIIRCHSNNSYTEFYITDESSENKCKKIIVSKGFGHFENLLVATGFFFRVHNQHIVNISHIKQYIRAKGCYLIMDDASDEKIPVARARKENFVKKLKLQGIMV